MNTLTEILKIALRHTPPPASYPPVPSETAIPGVSIFRVDAPPAPIPGVYEPLYGLVLSGRKRVQLGQTVHELGPGDGFLVTVDQPVIGTILEAGPGSPYATFALKLDLTALAAIELDSEVAAFSTPDSGLGFRIDAASHRTMDACLRLAQLLDEPGDIRVLAPLVQRELLYRLMTGPLGAPLRAILRTEDPMNRVAGAVAWLRNNFRREFQANEVARAARMSVSTLNRRFRLVTSMSPLEFQKHLRLQEARRLLMTDAADVAAVGRAVGYSNSSQFSREYRRLFGEPPGRDAARLRSRSDDAAREF
ncbi:MAG: AraC family transcriptional regulator [Planctomycetota bacterium]